MITLLSTKLADYVAKQDEGADPEIIAYGLELFLQQYLTLLLILILSIPLGIFLPTLCALAVFSFCRHLFGGVHAQTRAACVITYCVSIYGCLLASRLLTIPTWAAVVLFAVCQLLLLAYAPTGTEQIPIRENRGKRKAICMAFAALCFLTGLFLRGYAPQYGNMLLIIPCYVSLLTHPIIYRLYNCKTTSKETTE